MKDLYVWEKKFKSCYYSDRLISKILLIDRKTNIIDLNKIKKAIYYAKKYHAGQIRNSGEPYYTHPLAVAEMVAEHILKTDLLVVSILHDVLEDTSMTKEEMEIIFDLNIANQVNNLTRFKLGNKISIEEMIDTLWREKENDDLLLIKYFDRIHNLQTISYKSKFKIVETIEETFKKFLSLSFYLKSKNLIQQSTHEEMLNLCYQQLKIENVKSISFLSLFDNFHLSSLA